ncbi:MAG: hypothetical protein ABIH23_11165, partial [bacterium]
GIRVVVFDFPFICSPQDLDKHPEITSQSLDPNGQRTGEELYRPDLELTRQLSGEYFDRLTQELDADGIFYHPSTEMVRKIPVPDGNPQYYWDITYIQDYYRTFQRRKPDGTKAVVGGWLFMDNPADLRPLLPDDAIVAIVPGKEETERHINEYHALFPCWHWLYVFYSSEGIHSRLAGRGEYEGLRRRVNDAVSFGARGILPEAYVIRNHEAPLLYVTTLYRLPDLDTAEFNQDFCAQYFNSTSRAALGWEAYWKEQYRSAYEHFKTAFGKAQIPIIRDHIRDMALSALYLDIEKKTASPPDDFKGTKQEFLQLQKKAIDNALQTITDPFASEGVGDIWVEEMGRLVERIDEKLNGNS